MLRKHWAYIMLFAPFECNTTDLAFPFSYIKCHFSLLNSTRSICVPNQLTRKSAQFNQIRDEYIRHLSWAIIQRV